MNELKLLSLDFDGTMVGPWLNGTAAVSQQLIECLQVLRKAGALLAINTGRSLPLVDQGFELFPVRPDFALTTEREMFRWTPAGWQAFSRWNEHCQRDHERLFTDAAQIMADIEEHVSQERKVRVHRESGRLVGLIAQNNAEMDEVVVYLQDQCRRIANLWFQRNSIYLRFCHSVYHKGSVLQALQAELGIRAEETFAAGDNFNDLPMLDPNLARHLACPANSIEEVKQIVSSHGGYVAEMAGGDGVAEALRRACPQLESAGKRTEE
jgi:HAD superfamily hydrolase (TIGR01484 family)